MKYLEHQSFTGLFIKNNKVFDIFKSKTLTQLSNKIIKISKSFESFSYKDEDKLKGDLFEIFAECFFKILSADNRIGVYNYKPAPPNNDYGVDGYGTGMNDKPLTIQVKFRSDPKTELTQDDIKQFALQSIVNYNVDKDTKTNMIVFTNARGLHWATESKVFSGRIKSIGNGEISQLIDNNFVFWKSVNDLINETIKIKFNI